MTDIKHIQQSLLTSKVLHKTQTDQFDSVLEQVQNHQSKINTKTEYYELINDVIPSHMKFKSVHVSRLSHKLLFK